MTNRLKDKVAIVTGAGGNIGRAVTELFLAEGAKVVAVDHNEEALSGAGFDSFRSCLALKADVCSDNDMARVATAAFDTFGSIDIVFANAGVEGVIRHVSDYPDDVYDTVMAVNVKGVFLAMKCLAPSMSAGGSFMIASSIMGVIGAPMNCAYSASKHAVVGLMKSGAIGFALRKLRFNCIQPGLVESAMFDRIAAGFDDPKARKTAALSSIKLGRFVLPRDIANTALFLASDDSAMMTGQCLVVDGGQLL